MTIGMATGMKNPKRVGGYDVASLNRLSPQQQSLFDQLYQGSMGGIGSGLGHLSSLASGDQSKFAELESPALRQFSQLQGNLASRFSGAGSFGARKSSGFQNAMGAEASSLAERLQANRLGLQQSAIDQLLGISQQLLGRDSRENLLVKSPWLSFGESLAGGIGQGLGSFASGKMGM
ncbi:MAG: hypothetical protein KGZ39_00295 [Simkania sp.]|nr:hypothetical protein [Simkania sp.]